MALGKMLKKDNILFQFYNLGKGRGGATGGAGGAIAPLKVSKKEKN